MAGALRTRRRHRPRPSHDRAQLRRAPCPVRHVGGRAPPSSPWPGATARDVAMTAAAWSAATNLRPVGVLAGLAIASGSAAALPRKLAIIDGPPTVALGLAMRGHLGGGRQLGSALWRTYLPLAAAVALRSRRARVVLAAAAVGPGIADWRANPGALDPARHLAVRVLDDASYCVGVWAGCWRERTIGPLLPKLVNWPG